jgi:hypothetical protein
MTIAAVIKTENPTDTRIRNVISESTLGAKLEA